MSWITACVDIVDSTGARILQPNKSGAYQPFRLKMPFGTIASCSDRGDGTSEVSILQLGDLSFSVSYSTEMGVLSVPGINNLRAGSGVSYRFSGSTCVIDTATVPTEVIQSTGAGRRVPVSGTVVVDSNKDWAIDGSADVAGTNVHASFTGTTAVLALFRNGAIIGDWLHIEASVSAGAKLRITDSYGEYLFDRIVPTATDFALDFEFTTDDWNYRPKTSFFGGTPIRELAPGTDFPVSIANGVATLDPNNLLTRALWRRPQARNLPMASDAAVEYLLIGQTASTGIEGLTGLTLTPNRTHAAAISSRVTIVSAANPAVFAFVDIVTPVVIVMSGEGGAVASFVVDDAASAVSAIATSTMTGATASIAATTSSGVAVMSLRVTRPPGIACTVLRHDTAILELQEVA